MCTVLLSLAQACDCKAVIFILLVGSSSSEPREGVMISPVGSALTNWN